MKSVYLFSIFILILVVSMSNVMADISDGVIGYWTFDDDDTAGSITNDVSGNDRHLTIQDITDTGVECVLGECFEYNYTNTDWLNGTVPNMTSMTLAYWVKWNIVDANWRLPVHKDRFYDGNKRDFITGLAFSDVTSEVRFYVWQDDGNTDFIDSAARMTPDVWNFIVFTYNETNGYYAVWINGSINGGEVNDGGPGRLMFSHTDLLFGRTNDDGENGRYFDGYLDDVGLWNRVLTQDEITDLWNNGDGNNPFDETPSMTINTNFPNGNNTNKLNTLITYNGTLTDNTIDIANCTMINNGTIVNTTLNANLTILNSFNVSFGDVQGKFTLQINCTNFEANDTSELYWYSIDNINPIIKTDFNNNTVYNESDTVRLYFNFSDPNLFAYNVTIKDYDGLVYEDRSYFVENLTVSFAENLTTFIVYDEDVGNNYTVEVKVWDSHTDNEVKPIKIGKGDKVVFIDDFLIFENVEDFIAKLEDNDRYEFTLYFENESNYQEFYVKSTRSLHFIDDVHYLGGGYLVYDYQRWVDFNSNQISNLTIKKVNQGYKFEVYLIKEDSEIEFKSLGDLNTVEQVYYFSVQSQEDLNTAYLRSINENVQDIEEVLNMIPIVMMYLGFMTIGYWMIKSGNVLLGIMTYMLSVVFDFGLIGYYWDYFRNYASQSTIAGQFYSLFLIGFVFWILIKVFGLLVLRVRNKNIYK